MLVLVLQGSGNETLEQRVSAVRAALELGVELGAQVEVPARNLHSFYQAAVVPAMTRPFSSNSARNSLLNS